MQRNTVLLNEGKEVDVAPVDGAAPYLAQVLGDALAKPAVPTLRLVRNPENQPFVAVFVGSRHVGYLDMAIGVELAEILETVDRQGAEARARGRLVASPHAPGEAMVKVSLAEPVHLLADPGLVRAASSGVRPAVSDDTPPSDRDGTSTSQQARPTDLEQEWIAAWSSKPTTEHPVPQPEPTTTRSHAKTWILGLLLVAVLTAVGFAVWKTQFAPNTYTDPEYGYSFSYPRGWELMDPTQIAGWAGVTGVSEVRDVAGAWPSSMGDPTDFKMVTILLFDASVLGDPSQLAAEMQIDLTEVVTIMPDTRVIEPVTPTTVGGKAGWIATVATTRDGSSLAMRICYLIDGDLGYALSAVVAESSWSESQEVFDYFFDSFKPGDTRP